MPYADYLMKIIQGNTAITIALPTNNEKRARTSFVKLVDIFEGK